MTTLDTRGALDARIQAVPRPRPQASVIASGLVFLAFAVLGVLALIELDFSFSNFNRTIDNIANFFSRATPFVWPGWAWDSASQSVVWDSWAGVAQLWVSIGLTLGIVIAGTFLAALISIAVAYGAARNTTPNATVLGLCRAVGVVTRSIPDLAFAAIFVLLFGLGTLPGVLAIALHSIGMISKMMADSIEQIDEGPRLAIRSTGGTKAQEFWSGVVPQALPAWIAITLHRADINLRGTVILGYVGVVGLGYDLSTALHGGTVGYKRAIPIALVIVALCIVFEIVSSVVRARLLGVRPTGKGIGDTIVRSAAKKSTTVAAAIEPRTGVDRTAAVEQALRRPWDSDRITSTISVWLSVAVVVGAFLVARPDFTALFTNFDRLQYLGADRFWPLSFGSNSWGDVLEAVWVTLVVAFAATFLAAVASLFIGSFAARNVAPTPAVRNSFRVLLVGIRGLPELILAIIFIIITGLGQQAGTLALAIGGVGLLGKLIADSLEEVPNGPERALAAVGASRPQVFFASTLPISIPAFAGHLLYLLEQNVRAATLLGVVGGGGIGFLLYESLQVSRYNQVFAYLLVIIALVLVIESIAILIRRALK